MGGAPCKTLAKVSGAVVRRPSPVHPRASQSELSSVLPPSGVGAVLRAIFLLCPPAVCGSTRSSHRSPSLSLSCGFTDHLKHTCM